MTQLHVAAVYPAGPPDSDNAYEPAGTATDVTAALPVAPEIVVAGPVAVSVHAVATAVPPLSLMTCLISVRRGSARTPTVTLDVLFAVLVSTIPAGTATLAVLVTWVCASTGVANMPQAANTPMTRKERLFRAIRWN
ncbi:hypothetical protein D9M69_684450 [compost metagenome]